MKSEKWAFAGNWSGCKKALQVASKRTWYVTSLIWADTGRTVRVAPISNRRSMTQDTVCTCMLRRSLSLLREKQKALVLTVIDQMIMTIET